MGKMKGEIYKYYMLKYSANDPGNSSPRLPKWQCRFCSKTYVQNATKMRHHVLNMCEEIPAPLKLALLDIPNIQDESNDDAREFLNAIGVGGSSSSSPDASSPKLNKNNSSKQPPKNRKSLGMPYSLASGLHPRATSTTTNLNIFSNTSTVSTGDNDQDSLSVLLCRAILASGSSLSLLENSYWIDVFQRIAPGLILPTKNVILKDFMDQEFDRYQQDIEKQITDAKYVSMQCDVWKNSRDENMVTIVVNKPSPVSYKTFLTGVTNEDDPTEIADCAIRVIREIGESKVLSLVTKTNSQMTKVCAKLKSECPNTLTIGCVVEAFNKLLVSILEKQQIVDIVQTFKTICRKVKHSSAAKSKFDQIQREVSGKIRKIYLPSRSNWISHVTFVQNVQNIQASLRWLAVDEESRQLVTGDELHLLISDDIWTKVDILCKILHPVVKWLTRIKNKPEIYLVPKAFAECKSAFESAFEAHPASIWRDTLYDELLDCLTESKAACMQSVHFAANLLDPIEQGSCLTQDEILSATEFIDNFCDMHDLDAGAVVTELAQFRMKSDFYAKSFLWKVTENVQGSMWWSTMAPKNHLAQVAAALLNIAPSTFSMNDSEDSGNHGLIDCKHISVAHNLRLSNKVLSDSKPCRVLTDSTSGEDKKPYLTNNGDCDSESEELKEASTDPLVV